MRIFIILLSFVVTTSPALSSELFMVKQSNYSVSDTISRLAKILKSKGITIFARVDHAAGAAKVGTKLSPTQLLIFGNPKLGTPLMMANRKIGLDLPMKALSWRDETGKVWLAYTRPSALKSRHAIKGRDAIFQKMTAALDKLTNAAVSK